MNRLTRRNPDGAANFADVDFESVCAELTPANCEKVRAIVNKLAEYEDAEEQGRLVIMPFKREDNVWMVSTNEPMTVKSATVTVCAFDRNGRHEFPLTDWGRFIFPTKEAADEAFEKMAQEMVEAGGV